MVGYTITLKGAFARKKALEAVNRAPEGYRVTFAEPKRSVEQNDRLWAMLTDVSKQYEYYGKMRSPEDWKDIFTVALRDAETVPSLDGTGIVQLGGRTSKMSKTELGELMELIEAFCAEKGITLHEAA